MPTTPVNVSDLDGLFKEVYAEKLENLIPDNAVLVKKVPFQKKKRIGSSYNQPVILQQENGVTYAAAGAGAFALNAPINMATKNANVNSVQMLLRSQMDYETASKASGGNDARAFFNSTKLMVQSMLESMTHRLETSMLYGNTGVGTTASLANVDTTNSTITFSDATWGIGLWTGQEGAQIDLVEGGAVINVNGALVVSSIDVENKAVTVTGVAADIVLIEAAGAGQVAYWRGSWNSGLTNDMNGIDKIITNTGSLFGIDASDYTLWKGNSYAVGGAISVAALLKSTTLAVGKGGLKEAVDCYISPASFAVLNSELGGSGYRRMDSSYSVDKAKTGSTNIGLYAQNGMMNIQPHSMVKEGEGFILPTKYVCRLGSTDVTFDRFGDTGKFFRELNDNAGYEVRCYSDQTIFIEKPAVCTKLTGITSYS